MCTVEVKLGRKLFLHSMIQLSGGHCNYKYKNIKLVKFEIENSSVISKKEKYEHTNGLEERSDKLAKFLMNLLKV